MARTAALSVAVRLSADAVALCLRGFALLPSASFGQTSDRRHRGCPGMCHYARALARGCGIEPAAWVGLQPGGPKHCAAPSVLCLTPHYGSCSGTLILRLFQNPLPP